MDWQINETGWYSIDFINREGEVYNELRMLESGMEVKSAKSLRLVEKGSVLWKGCDNEKEDS